MDVRKVIQESAHLLELGRSVEAAEFLEERLRRGAPDPRLLHALAKVRLAQHRPEEAIPLLKRALALSPKKSDLGPQGSAPDKGTACPSVPPRGVTCCGETVDADDIILISVTADAIKERRTIFDPLVEDGPGPGQAPSPRATTKPQMAIDGQDSGSTRKTQPSMAQYRATAAPTSEIEPDSCPREEPTPDVVPLQAVWDCDDGDDEAHDSAQDEFEARLAEELAAVEIERSHTESDEDLALIFDGEARGHGFSELDWTVIDPPPVPIEPPDPPPILPTGVSWRERATQVAIELGLQFGWDRSGIEILTEVFDRWGWNSAKRAMQRELEAGLEPDELRLAIEARDVWSAHPEFAMDFSSVAKFGHPRSARATYHNLSWPMALRLVRTMRGIADKEYLEHFLCEQFDCWYDNPTTLRRLPAFNSYLYYRLELMGSELGEWPTWSFHPDPALRVEWDDEFQPGIANRHYRSLDAFDLIPRIITTPRLSAKKCEVDQPPLPTSAPDPETTASGAA